MPDREEFCTEVVKRTAMLDAFREEPHTMQELDDRLSMSRSTIHRTIRSFEDRDLLGKVDTEYVLTGYGRVLAEEATAFRRRVLTAARLDDFLNTVHPADVDIPFEHFGDATVTQPEPRQPHVGVKKIIDLIEASESLRMLSNIISPLYAEVALQEMIDGMEIEVVFDASVVEIIQSNYADEALRGFETGRFSVYVAPEVPFELFLYDDGMAMAAHDDSARPHMVVETDASGAVRWAEELYRDFKAGAEEVDPEFVGAMKPESD